MSVHAAEIGQRGTPAATRARLQAVDILRGLVMIVMALDHTRDFVHAAARFGAFAWLWQILHVQGLLEALRSEWWLSYL